jgi:MoaA/NifB/PqqE/SkfB family radical SAM enzyme
MRLNTLARLGAKHVRNAAAERLYLLNHRLDFTRPTIISGLVNERCNGRCRYCENWRLPDYQPEMTIEQWQTALWSLKRFAGNYSINFSGGEPFLKEGFLELLAFCRDHEITAGVTTNGSRLTEANVAELVAARPFNVNISVDGPREVHDYLRGYPGLFEKLSRGIELLRAERARQKADFPIIIKPTVTSKNFRHLPELVEWVGRIGATAVHFQPLDRRTVETYDELWIERSQLEEFVRIVERLIEMKQAGAPILNSVRVLRLQPLHFREEQVEERKRPRCRIALRTFLIMANGDVLLCYGYPPAGNLTRQSVSEIWRGTAARALRRIITDDNPFRLNTSLSEKTIREKIEMGLILRQRHANRLLQETPVA